MDTHVSHSVYVSFTLDMRDVAFSDKYASDIVFWMDRLGWANEEDSAWVRSAVAYQDTRGVESPPTIRWDLEAFQERKGKVGFLVWTTTPWTLSANMVC
jgi:isoleucyl-tRNA synthetase